VLDFTQRAEAHHRTIVFPEGENLIIIRAAAYLNAKGLIIPILLGNPEQVKEISCDLGEDLSNVNVLDPAVDERLIEYIESYSKERSLPGSVGRRIVSQPLCFGAMMVKRGEADGMVAGINHPTNEVIMASGLIIGLRPDISLSSSFYLMDIPDYEGSEGSLLIFADPAVNPNPNPVRL